MDRLILRDLRFFGYHGIFPEENKRGQHFAATLELELPLAPAGRSDDIGQAVNYCDVQAITREIMEGPPRGLIETLAEQIAAALLARFPTVSAVTVEVLKPEPPVTFDFAGVAVRIRRERGTQS
ncbi:MAG: dihydroneopterin aldolase [Verrucomicrobia bacterium]|nr:dihydroneopterin aldolase [Verrucomicrobiota bacterium]